MIFAASSKRAFSSITTVTCLPLRAAFDQLLDKRRIGAGPVERLFDGEHMGVFRGLGQKIHDRLEVIVGMVQENVAPPDVEEDVRFGFE